MPLVNLLSTRPGTFVYHLLAFLASGAMTGIAFTRCRHNHNPVYCPPPRAFGGLLALRALLLVSEPLGSVIAAPHISGMEVASANLLGWAFVATYLDRRARDAYLIGGLGAPLLCVILFLPEWQSALDNIPDPAYITFWQPTFWHAASTLLALVPALILLLRRQWKTRQLSILLGFAILTLGYATLGTSSLLPVDDQSGIMIAYTLTRLGHLINLLSYIVFVFALHRISAQGTHTHRQESPDTSGEASGQIQDPPFLPEVIRSVGESLDLHTVLHRGAKNTAVAVNANRCAIFLIDPGRAGSIKLAAHSDLLQHTERKPTRLSFALSERPILHYVLERRKQLTFTAKANDPRLHTLYRVLGSEKIGPTIVQPLLHQRRVLGALVVGNDASQRAFTPSEEHLCHIISAQIAGAIENARLYRDKEAQARELANSLQSQKNENLCKAAILESISEGVIVGDQEGRIVLVNTIAEQLLGESRQRILGHSIEHIAQYIPSLPQDKWSAITHTPTFIEKAFQLEDNLIQISTSPVLTPAGDHLGVVIILHDITKETEFERSKSEFTTTISRELFTPLTAIHGYAEALSSSMVGPVSQAQSQLLRIIRDNALHVISLTKNLLAVSQIEKGFLKLKYGETDLHRLAQDVANSFQSQLKVHQLKISLELDDDLHTIEADPARVQQILDNLVSNAIKFTYPGGHITIGAKPLYDDEVQPSEHCLLWVSDTGIGIDPEEQPRIWKPFYRPIGLMTAETSGLGVGLSIVKSLVEAHRGRVWVDSTPGVGSTFTILLPTKHTQSVGD
jgi:PAS domain S-box-containing protein